MTKMKLSQYNKSHTCTSKFKLCNENMTALRQEVKQSNPFLLLLCNMVLEILARAIKEEKEIKGVPKFKRKFFCPLTVS